MKLKLSELNPNPFKIGINKGKLNEESIKKIRSNIKELGLMGSLPIIKRDGKYFLVAGHHRVEALKREFGKDYPVEVVIHNYSDDQLLRGMVIENITQRSDELLEVSENLNTIRKYLKENPFQHLKGVDKRKDGRKLGENQIKQVGSIPQIASWLNLNGEVMSIGKISQFLQVYDNLDKQFLKQVEVSDDGRTDKGKIGITEAVNLARLPIEKQKEVKEILDETDLIAKEKGKIISQYLEADEDIKKDFLDGKIDAKKLEVKNMEREMEKINPRMDKEVSKFIPSFDERLREFSHQVNKLELQIDVFRNVFRNPNFHRIYRGLGVKEKNFMNNSIDKIEGRIKYCLNEVEYFKKQMESEQK